MHETQFDYKIDTVSLQNLERVDMVKNLRGLGMNGNFCLVEKKNCSKHLGYVLLTLKRCSQASTLDEETDLILSFD